MDEELDEELARDAAARLTRPKFTVKLDGVELALVDASEISEARLHGGAIVTIELKDADVLACKKKGPDA